MRESPLLTKPKITLFYSQFLLKFIRIAVSSDGISDIVIIEVLRDKQN